MRRYVELGTGRALIEDLKATGVRTKTKTARGGIAFTRGPLFHLLNNQIYLGKIVHKGTAYAGEHDAIVPQELWDAVQACMAEKRVERTSGGNVEQHSLLAGNLVDGEGRKMSPSHAIKKLKRYRYYVTHAAELTDIAKPAWRVPAHDLEVAVIQRLKKMLIERRAIAALLGPDVRADALNAALLMGRSAAAQLEARAELRQIVNGLVEQVRLGEEHIEIQLSRPALVGLLAISADTIDAPSHIILATAAAKVRRGKDVKLVVADDDGRADGMRDDVLVGVLAEARACYDVMLEQPDRSIKELAKATNRCRTRFAQLLRIAMLAPDIIQSCIEGTQPMRLTARTLLSAELPIAWSDQRVMLGFN